MLPSGFKQLTYIEGDGTAYIDTGFKANQDTSAEVEFSPLETPTNVGIALLFGSSGAWANASFGVYKFSTWYSNYNSDTPLSEVTIPVGTKAKVYKNKNLVYIDDTLVYTHTAITFQATNNLLLGKISISSQYGSYAKYYKCKIWDNGTLVREMVPAERVSDNAIGMYDAVNSLFYANAGSGSFTPGPYAGTVYNIKKSYYKQPSKIPSGYTELEYIHTDANAYINTGVSLSSFLNKTDSRIVMKLAWTDIASATGRTFQVNGWQNNPQIGIQSERSSSPAFWQNYNTGTEPVTENQIYTATLDFAGNVGVLKVPGFTDLQAGSTASSSDAFRIGGFTGIENQPVENIYEVWIYQDGLIHHYIPCRNSSNVIGMYDVVTDTFYSSVSGTSFTAGPMVNIPDEYQELDYIQSTGVQYLNLGFKANQDTIIETTFDKTNYSSTSFLYGARTSISSNTYQLQITPSSYFQYNSGETNMGTLSEGTHTFKQDKQTAYLDGVNKGSRTYSTFETPTNMILFARSSDSTGTIDSYARANIRSFKAWDNTNQIRNLVPAKRKSDNVLGMYDKCNSGKNLLGGYDETLFGYYNTSGNFITDTTSGVITYQYISLKPNTTYTISYNCDTSCPNNYARISEFTSGKSHIKRTLIGAGISSAYYSYTFTTTNNTAYIAIGEDKKGTENFGNITNVQIEEGSTATAYEPYDGFYTNAGTGVFIAGNPVYNNIEIKKSYYVNKILPDGYTELEYLQSNGTQYIDTENRFIASTDTLEVKYENTGGTTSFKWAFGSYGGASLGITTGSVTTSNNFYYNNVRTIDSSYFTGQHTFLADSNGVSMDGTNVASYLSFSTSSNIYLFATNNSGSVSNHGNYKIYSYKQTRNGSDIINLIPAKNSDNVYGLYDLVSNTFLTNSGTGTFTAGPEISRFNIYETKQSHYFVGG